MSATTEWPYVYNIIIYCNNLVFSHILAIGIKGLKWLSPGFQFQNHSSTNGENQSRPYGAPQTQNISKNYENIMTDYKHV